MCRAARFGLGSCVARDVEERFVLGRDEDLLEETVVRRVGFGRVEDVEVRGDEREERSVSEYPESWRDIFEDRAGERGFSGETTGWERGHSSMLEGWSWAEWKVAASEIAETLDSDRLCQLVFKGCRCLVFLAVEAILDSGLIVEVYLDSGYLCRELLTGY